MGNKTVFLQQVWAAISPDEYTPTSCSTFPFSWGGGRGAQQWEESVGTDGETEACIPETWGSQDSDPSPDYARLATSQHHTEHLGLPG